MICVLSRACGVPTGHGRDWRSSCGDRMKDVVPVQDVSA